MNRGLVSLAFLLAALPVVASASLPPRLAAQGASSLRPGDYLWDEGNSGIGPVTVMISIDRQHVYVWRDDALIGVSTVSTGKPGKTTPMGEFRILQKNVWHRSNLYSNAPMPYMQRLTWGGIAIHAGQLPGYPASHGCIRVPLAFAKKLFAATDMGGVVSVSDGQSGPYLRIEADVASIATDAVPAWDGNAGGRARVVRMAQAQPSRVPKPTPATVLPVALQPVAPLPKPVKMAQVTARPLPAAPRLATEKLALAQADLSIPPATPAEPARDPGQPHWRVPYYQPLDAANAAN